LHKPHNSLSIVSEKHAIGQALTTILPNESATTDFASDLSKVLIPGIILYLRGDLGAGKTTLVRALLNAFGYIGRVKSPTYTLLEHYDAGGLSFRHFDLYRFRDETEWEEVGFNDEFDGRNICLIEWPERAALLLPPCDIEIIFEILTDGRKISLFAHTNTGNECLHRLEK
jgi:tRNA threonylcarbamoyladenosine biosynthesis protein TsaE